MPLWSSPIVCRLTAKVNEMASNEFEYAALKKVAAEHRTMAKLTHAAIESDVRRVLQRATMVKGRVGGQMKSERSCLTAYPILERLEPATRDRLVREFRNSGKGAGHHFSAANFVAQTARALADVEIRWIDTKELSLNIRNQSIKAGCAACALNSIPLVSPVPQTA